MKIPAEGKLLRIFIGEQDEWHGLRLYEAIVNIARKEKMAGATVLKGCMGFGCKSHMHTAKLERLSEDLPMVIEIVDSEEKINNLSSENTNILKFEQIVLKTEKIDTILSHKRKDHLSKS